MTAQPLSRGRFSAQQVVDADAAFSIRRLSVHANGHAVLQDVSLNVPRGRVVTLEGPSGVGKSTFLRCLNRLIDLDPGLRCTGEVTFGGRSVFDPALDPDRLRRRVGMLFQQPVLFPGSIEKNVLFGARRQAKLSRDAGRELAERTLKQVALWDEVRLRLDRPAEELSVGQQQRLCLARTLAVEPEAVLMDEPTSALDPEATAAIEALVAELSGRLTLLVVTHDREQARRLADLRAVFRFDRGRGVLDQVSSRPRAQTEAIR